MGRAPERLRRRHRPPAGEAARTFATKRDALAHRKAVAAGRVGSDDEMLAEFLDGSWLPSKEGRVERSTLDQYRWAVRLHIVPLLGAVRLRDLSPEVVDGWVADSLRR